MIRASQCRAASPVVRQGADISTTKISNASRVEKSAKLKAQQDQVHALAHHTVL
jgi:hypothetical protein